MTVVMHAGLADARAVEKAEGQLRAACKLLQEQVAVSEDNAQQLQQALAVAQASCCCLLCQLLPCGYIPKCTSASCMDAWCQAMWYMWIGAES